MMLRAICKGWVGVHSTRGCRWVSQPHDKAGCRIRDLAGAESHHRLPPGGQYAVCPSSCQVSGEAAPAAHLDLRVGSCEGVAAWALQAEKGQMVSCRGYTRSSLSCGGQRRKALRGHLTTQHSTAQHSTAQRSRACLTLMSPKLFLMGPMGKNCELPLMAFTVG